MTLTEDSDFIRARTTTIALGNGLKIGVRPIVPSDREGIAEALARVSEQSRFRRFFRVVTSLTDRELDYLTEVDYRDHFAWIAHTVGSQPGLGQEGLGVARYIRLPEEPHVAEAAITVVDEYQRMGIGRILLELLSESAQGNGIRVFRGYALPENRPLLDSAARRGLSATTESGVARLDVELPPPTGLEASHIYSLLKEVAAGAIEFGR